MLCNLCRWRCCASHQCAVGKAHIQAQRRTCFACFRYHNLLFAHAQVAVLCNHQRAVGKAHDSQMEKMQGKLAEFREQVNPPPTPEASNLCNRNTSLWCHTSAIITSGPRA